MRHFLWSAFLDTNAKRNFLVTNVHPIMTTLWQKAKKQNQIELDKYKAYVEDRYPFPVQSLPYTVFENTKNVSTFSKWLNYT